MLRSLTSSICVAGTIVAAMASLSLPAQARDTVGVDVRVNMRDIDFNAPAQVQAFHRNLQAAASRACDVPGGSLDIRQDNADCRARALEDVVVRIHQPELSRQHALAREQGTREDGNSAQVARNDSRNW